MKIALVAAEIAPYAKVGGLADVIGALPQALAKAGAEPSVIVPAYRSLVRQLEVERVASGLSVRVGAENEKFSVLRAFADHTVPLYLIDHPGYFDRNEIYGENGRDYPDGLRRFIFFGRAAAETAARLIRPDVLHAHDWHAAMLPIVARADHALRQHFQGVVSVFTVHNVAFQGICEAADFSLLNLDPSWFSIDCLEFYGRINLMKGAVVLADGASTVSPTYAREVSQDAELAFGLEGVFRAKGDRFVGILNGADYNEWNPATDRMIAAKYDGRRPAGKRKCRQALTDLLKLPGELETPVLGMVTRLTAQKGIDLLLGALDAILSRELRLVILGSGDPQTENFLRAAEQRNPERLRAVIGFDNTLAHQIQAGCDMFLMPSRFEPCGLTQMYALKYGTVPIVRATGGLKDTVQEFLPALESGNGFVFNGYNGAELLAAIDRACQTYRNRNLWRRLMKNCFACDFSSVRSARNYLDWFGKLQATRAAA